MILDPRCQLDPDELSLHRDASDAFPRRQVERVGLSEPHVPVDSRALVEPSVAKARVHAHHDAVLRAHRKKVGNVEAEWRVAVIVAADEAPVHEDEHIAKRSVELHRNPSPGVARWNVKLAPIPPHACFRIAPAQRLESMRCQRVVPNERQLHRPVVGQVQRAPFRVVVPHTRNLEVVGLAKVFLRVSETEILGRVRPVAELELPARVEEQFFARTNRASPAGIRLGGHKGGGTRPTRTSQQRRS